MKQRIITGGIFGAVLLSLIYVGGLPYSCFILLLAFTGMHEFLRMVGLRSQLLPSVIGYGLLLFILWPALHLSVSFGLGLQNLIILAMLLLFIYTVVSKNHFHIEHVALIILGALYIGFGFYYMAAVRHSPESNGFWMTLLILFGVWATDTGAYFIGRKWGRRKLWPAISPKKTIEGSVGGLFLAVAVILLINEGIHLVSMGHALAIAVVTSLAAQLGDFVESGMKRHYGIKDSGQILPGHGGVLDRMDSMLYVFPVLHVLGVL